MSSIQADDVKRGRQRNEQDLDPKTRGPDKNSNPFIFGARG